MRRVRDVAHRKWFAYTARGDAVRCPVCSWGGARFFGGATCPTCRSIPRTRLFAYTKQVFTLHLAGTTILHVAPNPPEARWLESQRPAFTVGLDLQQTPRVHVSGDVTRLPFREGSFDACFAWHVLEHITDDTSALVEIARVVRRGGKFVVSVPIHPPGAEKTWEDGAVTRPRFKEVYGHHDHVRACGLDYKERIIAAGFAVDEYTVAGAIERGDHDVQRLGLSAKHVAWCGTRTY